SCPWPARPCPRPCPWPAPSCSPSCPSWSGRRQDPGSTRRQSVRQRYSSTLLSWHDLLRGRDCKTSTSEIVKPAFTARAPTLSFWALPARPLGPALAPAPPTSGIGRRGQPRDAATEVPEVQKTREDSFALSDGPKSG